MTILNSCSFPKDLKTLTVEELKELSCDIREFLIESVSKTGGHLASNLGVVELTIGLHRVFESPEDKIIWDVGHQAYVHKILTGRINEFEKLRCLDGMSGFPKSCESPHDIFDTGHGSNSVSLACGLVAARDIEKDNYNVITVIGDGALTGGMAYEGLNNLGYMKSKSIVILNDNGMSISKNTGSISMHLNKLRISSDYIKAKRKIRNALNSIPVIGKGLTHGISHAKNTLKYAFVDSGAIFEQLGFTYIGPIDGHDISQIIEVLELAKESPEPVLIHMITQKGKGYSLAETEPDRFHGIGPFDIKTGDTGKSKETFSSVFGKKLVNMTLSDDKITAVCAAMTEGTGLKIFSETFPERFFDVGIAEEHAVSFACGLAKGGYKPVVCIYSTFLQRGYDQLLMDVCLQKLPVVFAIDRGGIVGKDGETHHGIFDLSYLTQMPGMTVLAPRNYTELESMMEYALKCEGPCAIRYPRGSENILSHSMLTPSFEDCTAQVMFTGKDVEIWACGNMADIGIDVFRLLDEKGIKAGLVNARSVKPLDTAALLESASRTSRIVTLEDNSISGGFGSQIALELNKSGKNISVLSLGWPDTFIEHGSPEELYKRYGLDAVSVSERICDFIENS